jgi:hypothetical protein
MDKYKQVERIGSWEVGIFASHANPRIHEVLVVYLPNLAESNDWETFASIPCISLEAAIILANDFYDSAKNGTLDIERLTRKQNGAA